MSSFTKMFVPSVVVRRSLRAGKPMLPLVGGMAEIPLGALQRLPMPVYPSFQEVRQAHAETLGHICQDWEYSPDEDSPSEWCPGCSYLAKKRSEDLLQKSFLEAWLRDAQPQKPQPSPEEHERRMAAERAARWSAWLRTLPSWDLDTLRLGGVAAKLLVKTCYYKQQLSWCDRLDAEDPGWDVRVVPQAPRPVVAAPAPLPLLPRPAAPSRSSAPLRPAAAAASWRPALPVVHEALAGGAPAAVAGPALFGGVSAEQWLVSQDSRPAAIRDGEVAAWLDVKKNVRPIFVGRGRQLPGVAQANSSSLLVTGFGRDVCLADIRLLASLVCPVRDLHLTMAGNTVFVEMLEADGAARGRALFAENPVVLGGRQLIFDVAQRNNSSRYSGRR